MMGDERRMTKDEGAGRHPSFVRGRPSSIAGHPSFVVTIDELVLEGFNASERYHIGEAVAQELTRLFETGALNDAWIAAQGQEALDAGAFPYAPTARSETIGAQIAQAVYMSSETWSENRNRSNPS